MGAEAEVGVKNKAGGQVIVLAQFSGCHSVRPHGALKIMLLLAPTGHRNVLCATQKLSVCPTACLSVGEHGVGGAKLTSQASVQE